MKILVVGDGGREHALLWKLHRDHPGHEYFVTRGNAGTDTIARAIDRAPGEVAALLNFAEEEGVEYVVVGPEVSLAAGIVDAFRGAGIGVFGPTRAAARIESSKAFAKRLMAENGVPTGRFDVFHRPEPAARFVEREMGVPCVVKASGLAAGKGAFVCRTPGDVTEALDACLVRRDFGEAGAEIVVEEFLEGEELSILALTDGKRLVPFIASQDHKAAEEGDRGPNTGGMGAYAPVSIVDQALLEEIVDGIFRPTLDAMAGMDRAFTGCLYAGLMITAAGPCVLEWNARFGDPETQALLPLLESDLLELMRATGPEGSLAGLEARWRKGAAITVVASAKGYPGPYATDIPISIPDDLARPESFDESGVVVFHAGTTRSGAGIVSSGGRVLGVTAAGGDLVEARERAYAAIDRIEAPGLRCRRDIGWRELARIS